MQLVDILRPDRVLAGAQFSSKKKVLMALAELMASEEAEVSARDVFESLCAREQIGSTTLGNGAAIPHARLGTPGFASGAFIRLAEPVDFDAADNQPVDLVFALTTCEMAAGQQMELLSTMADMFSDPQFCKALRGAQDDAELFDLVTGWESHRASA